MLAKRVRCLREARGLNQSQLARRAGVSAATISTLERGVTLDPGVLVAMKLARALGCTLHTLVGWDEGPGAWTLEVPKWGANGMLCVMALCG